MIYVGGFTAGMIATGDWGAANQAGLNGLWSSAAIGGLVGAGSGYFYAKNNNIDPWSGVKKNSIVIGEGMDRVASASKDLKTSNIDKDWPKDVKAYYSKRWRIVNADAMDFNAQWLNTKMERNYYLYDIGTPNGAPISSPFYNMEVSRTMVYPNVVPVKSIQILRYFRITTF